MLDLKSLIAIGGLLHLGLLAISIIVPRVFDWRDELSKVSPFLRRHVWVYAGFIALILVGFGVISLRHAEVLASGHPLARSLCGFIAFFWLIRVGVYLFIFDPEGLIRHAVLKVGYHGLSVVFVYF